MVEATPSPEIDREPDESSVRVVLVAIPPSSPRRHRVSGARLDAQAEKSQTPATAILNFFGRGAPTPDPFATIPPLSVSDPNALAPFHRQIKGGAPPGDEEPEMTEEERQLADGVAKLAELTAKYEVSPFLLDPRSRWMKRWDIIIGMALVYTATITPYEVAFLDSKGGGATHAGLPTFPIYIINVIIDLLFFADVIAHFNLIYYDEESANGMYVTDRQKIVRRYVRGFFVVDVVSIIPFHEMESAGGLKALKLLRLLRLVKLLRILRSGRILKRLEDSMNVNYNVLSLVKFILGTLMIAHWLACFWKLTGRTVAEKDDWVTNYYSNFVDSDLFATCYAETELPNELHACMNLSPWNMYIAALYWALVTMSTIGYGDVTPTNTEERFFVILAMLIGTSVFAYVVGSVCGIVASMDKKSNEHHERMDTLNAMSREMQVGDELQMRLRDYFRYRHTSTNIEEWFELLELMSPSLRGEVALKQCGSWINNVPFFHGAPDGFIVDIALKLKTETFPQGEEIVHAGQISTKMYIVERGVVGGKGRVFTSGKVFGEEVLGGGSQAAFTARAMTYCDVFGLPGTDLEDTATNYPAMRKRLRVAGCRGMIKDSLIAFAQAWGHIEKGVKENPNGSVEEAQVDPMVSVPELAVVRRKDDIFKFALSVARDGGAKPALPSDPAGAFKAINRTVIEETVDPGGDKVDRVLSAVERLERKLAALEAKLK